MLSLAAAALIIKSLHPVATLPIGSSVDVPVYAYTRDASFEYLGTPEGLYRSPRLATAKPELFAFAGETITALAQRDGAIYVGKASDHSLLRLRGGSFEPLDAALRDCAVTPCAYLVPTRIGFGPSHLYVNAGGNLLASDDDGATWHLLYGLPFQGKPTTQLCPVQFERIGERMLLGGECPLDTGWLSRGTLNPNFVSWAEQPAQVTAPQLENRNVQFIRDIGGAIYAGIEGGLLESTDGGATFRYVIHYPLDAEDRYPYIQHLVAASGLLIAAGFDKKNDTGYLAYSTDGGETWTDASELVGTSYVTLLMQDADGRVVAGLQDRGSFTLAEVVLGERGKRRAVR